MPSSSHDGSDEHRILVAFATGDNQELLYLRYCCEDPTCDWAIVEYGPDECNNVATIVDNLLTDENCHAKINDTQDGDGAHAKRSARVQPSMQKDLFRGSDR